MDIPLRGLSLQFPPPPRSFASITQVGLEVIYESMTASTSLFVCGSSGKVKAPVIEGQFLSWD